jgi:transposase
MAKLYRVKLLAAQREELRALVSKGEGKAQRMRRAQTLLLADAGKADQSIAEALQIHRTTVERTRRRFAEEGLEAALSRRQAPKASTPPKLDGAGEAHLIALVCGSPPEGHARWSLRLIASRLVTMGEVEAISHETVRRVLKKKQAQALAQRSVGDSSPGQRRVRLAHGGRAGGLPKARESKASACLPGRGGKRTAR